MARSKTMKYINSLKLFTKKILFHAEIRNDNWLKTQAESCMEPELTMDFDTNISSHKSSQAEICERRDRYIKKLLSDKIYSFKNPLVIINPFSCSPLSALIIFNTEEKACIRYTIKGMREARDYTSCIDTHETEHAIPVLGLFDGCINNILLELLDENKNVISQNTIKIKTAPAPRKLAHSIDIRKKEQPFSKNFIFATGGYSGANYAFDEAGNIRWYLTSQIHPYGLHLLGNGHLLAPLKNIRRPNYGNAHSVIANEIDFLGRVYHTYCHPEGYHHWCISKSNKNLIMASSSIHDNYMENVISEIDYLSGNTIRSINVNDIFDETYITRYDWAHVNAFEYIEDEYCVIVSFRNIHTIAKIDMTSKQIIWLLANPDFYKNTLQRNKVLTPDTDVKWFFQQHGVKILKRKNTTDKKIITLALFDNHTANRRPVDYFDESENSSVKIFEIDENEMSVKMTHSLDVPMSATRSNIDAELTDNTNIIYGMSANLEKAYAPYRSCITGFDFDTNKLITQIYAKNDFFCAKFIDFEPEKNMPDTNSKFTSMENNYIRGSLSDLVNIRTLPDKIKNAPAIYEQVLDSDDTVTKVQFKLVGNILEIFAKDHELKNVYLSGPEDTYKQTFTDTKQLTKIFKQHSYFHAVSLDTLPAGRYDISLEYGNYAYSTPYWIEKK